MDDPYRNFDFNYYDAYLGPYKLFHYEGSYHIETSPLICSANQWTNFNVTRTSTMKEFYYMNYLFQLSTNISQLTFISLLYLDILKTWVL